MTHPAVIDRPLGRLGNVDVSTYETATGARLRLRRADRVKAETYLDPLELEGLTRVRYKPMSVLLGASPQITEDTKRPPADPVERLQNEFAMVDVGVARENGEAGLIITDLNAGLTVLLTPRELEALVIARHMDFAPLIDTSDLVAIPEPDIDQA